VKFRTNMHLQTKISVSLQRKGVPTKLHNAHDTITKRSIYYKHR